ncbi:MAG TPA: hypothetical protein VIY47_13935, partial [Ignavibacteriaceae bacterium]
EKAWLLKINVVVPPPEYLSAGSTGGFESGLFMYSEQLRNIVIAIPERIINLILFVISPN